MKLDLLNSGRLIGGLFGQFGGAGFNAKVGVVNVVQEDLRRLVAFGSNPVIVSRDLLKCSENAYLLKKIPIPSRPNERQYCSNRP